MNNIIYKQNINNFSREISQIPGGEDIRKCFACGTCTISCPIFEINSDYNPRKIIRMALLGMREELLKSEIIWSCVNCYTCYERCPQNVKFTAVINAIRNLAVKEAKSGKIKIKAPGYFLNDGFLKSVKLHGRVWEPELMLRLWLKLLDIKRIFSFIPLGIEMFKKRKIPFLPSRIKGKKEINRLFKESNKKANSVEKN